MQTPNVRFGNAREHRDHIEALVREYHVGNDPDAERGSKRQRILEEDPS